MHDAHWDRLVATLDSLRDSAALEVVAGPVAVRLSHRNALAARRRGIEFLPRWQATVVPEAVAPCLVRNTRYGLAVGVPEDADAGALEAALRTDATPTETEVIVTEIPAALLAPLSETARRYLGVGLHEPGAALVRVAFLARARVPAGAAAPEGLPETATPPAPCQGPESKWRRPLFYVRKLPRPSHHGPRLPAGAAKSLPETATQ